MKQVQGQMNFDDLIDRLRALQMPDPALDRVLFQLLTWKQNYAKLDGGEDEERVRWLATKTSSSGGEYPNYTGSLQQAYAFARQIATKERGGFSWEIGTASAIIGQDASVQATGAPIALIIAALKNLADRLHEVKPVNP